MQASLNNNKICCPVCKLRYNKDSRLPIYMLCCRKTACQSCVDKVMSKSSLTNDGIIPDGKFSCSLCQSKVYALKDGKNNVPLSVNEALLDLVDSSENFLPIYCDQHPLELVSWYSSKTKQLISNVSLTQHSDLIPSCLPFSKPPLDAFFQSAQAALLSLNQLVLSTIK